jgi:hypothetical protein
MHRKVQLKKFLAIAVHVATERLQDSKRTQNNIFSALFTFEGTQKVIQITPQSFLHIDFKTTQYLTHSKRLSETARISRHIKSGSPISGGNQVGFGRSWYIFHRCQAMVPGIPVSGRHNREYGIAASPSGSAEAPGKYYLSTVNKQVYLPPIYSEGRRGDFFRYIL